MTREERIRSLFDTSGRLLEIGPSYSPILPKRYGFNVEIVDSFSQEQLQNRYRDLSNVDWRKIETVDYVWSGSLLDAIPHRKRYDVIFASNVIEHTPNLIRFLQECEALLSDSGKLALIVPDKRYCFDFFRSLTSTGDVLQANIENRTRHLPGHLFDHIASFATQNGSGVWDPQTSKFPRSANDLIRGYDEVKIALATSDYVDCHAWTFTPSSFRIIAQDLHALGLSGLKEEHFVPSISWYEFLVIFSKDGKGCGLDRQSLLQMTEDELRSAARVVDPKRRRW